MHVRDQDTVPPDQIYDGHSARDIVVLIGVLHHGEIRAVFVEITPGTMWRWQKTIATTHHDQVHGGESVRDTVFW